MVTNRYRETNRRYEKNHAAFFYQQRRLITATIQFFDLFSGIGGFREGLRRAGGFTCVGHCEVDTYADKNYRLLFDTEGEWYCSDARTIEPERMPDFDLLCAGFPCQAFSIAGKREGFADARGTLFFEIARLLKAKRPQYLSLKMFPVCFRMTRGGHFAPSSVRFRNWGTMSNGKCLTARISESPKQGNGCILSDILISDVPEKYYLNQKQMEQLLFKYGQEVRGKESTVQKD